MEFKLERRFSRGLMLRGSYTLSRGWDDASEVYQITPISPFPQDQLNAGNARKGEHGLSAYDVTHRFAIAYVYEVPGFSSSNNLLNHIAYLTRGWQWSSTASLQSGLPNTPFVGGIDTNGDGNALNGRPNVGIPMHLLVPLPSMERFSERRLRRDISTTHSAAYPLMHRRFAG